MPRIKNNADSQGRLIGRSFVCPGCGSHHVIHVEEKNASGAQWSFNGDYERPTFVPSINSRIGPYGDEWGVEKAGAYDVCHFFVKAGRIEFLGDCTHKLAGSAVDLPEIR